MRVWFTADLHLGHGNIIKYCDRPYLTDRERELLALDPRGKWRVSDETLGRHDAALLHAINASVAEGDTLWVVGDFSLRPSRQVAEFRERIACRDVRLVWGNHDTREAADAFDHVTEEEMVTIDGQDIWLCHYPQDGWPRREWGAWHLYGHVHGRLFGFDAEHPELLRRDIGVDACDYRPWSFEDVREWMRPRMAGR